MASLLKIVAERFRAKEPLRTLQKLHETRTPLRLEVENSETSFFTVLSLRDEFVVIGRPPDLESNVLKKDGFVRFVVPDGSNNVLRMRILSPNRRRERGDTVVICELPEEFAEKSRREAERYNTGRFKNLHLELPQVDASFRIIDISRRGCKTYIGDRDNLDGIRVGDAMRFAKVEVGEKGVIELDLVTPRLITPPTASFQWDVSHHGDSAAFLHQLIEMLHKAEFGRLKVSERPRGKQRAKHQGLHT